MTSDRRCWGREQPHHAHGVDANVSLVNPMGNELAALHDSSNGLLAPREPACRFRHREELGQRERIAHDVPPSSEARMYVAAKSPKRPLAPILLSPIRPRPCGLGGSGSAGAA